MGPREAETLKDLLGACARRDEAAFSRLYGLTSAKLFGVALRILRREDWAEEVLQDCYVSIWNRASSYAPALSAPMTWMTTIVRNRCLDWLRRPKLEVPAELLGPDSLSMIDAASSDDPGPLELLSRSSDARALADCLNQLDANRRRAVVLAFIEGLTHPELAARLGQPLGTVKTWVRRGLLQLRGCLETR